MDGKIQALGGRVADVVCRDSPGGCSSDAATLLRLDQIEYLVLDGKRIACWTWHYAGRGRKIVDRCPT